MNRIEDIKNVDACEIRMFLKENYKTLVLLKLQNPWIISKQNDWIHTHIEIKQLNNQAKIYYNLI